MLFGVLLFFNLNAQEPTAVLSSYGDTAICEAGTIKFKILFMGGSFPYGYLIKVYPLSNPDNWGLQGPSPQINENDLVDGYFMKEFPVTETTVIELISIYDGNSPTPWSSGNGYNSVSGSVTFYVDHTPVPDAGPDITDQCGYSVQLLATPQDTENQVYWDLVADGSFNDPNIANPVFSNALEQTYKFMFNEVSGACTGKDSLEVTFLGSPSGTLSGENSYCKTGNVDVAAELTGNGPWSYTLTNGTDIQSRSNISSPSDAFQLNVSGNQVYQFGTLTDVNGCEARDDQKSGEVTGEDIQPIITAGEDKTSCSLSTTLEGSADKGIGTWSSLATGITFTDSSDPLAGVTSAQYDFVTLTWTVDNNGCMNSDDVVINFAQLPSLTLDQSSAIICEGTSTSIDLTMSGNAPWQVSYNDGIDTYTPSFSESPVSINFNPTNTTDYHFTEITGNYGCVTILDDVFNVNVESIVTANAGEDQEFERQYESTLTGSPSGVNGTWELVSGRGLIAEPNNPTSTVTGLSVGENIFKWTVTPEVCESSSDEVIIKVNKYTSYNGFSPNDDGINDKFIIDGATSDVTNKLVVLDQLGQVVYEKDNYDNKWTGVDNSGNQLDDGVYYFIFTSLGSEPIKDYVIIKREVTQ